MRLTEWKRITLDGQETARVTCPECKHEAILDHEIAADGTVTPSLDCPTDGCGFHEHVVLAGWQRKELRSVPESAGISEPETDFRKARGVLSVPDKSG